MVSPSISCVGSHSVCPKPLNSATPLPVRGRNRNGATAGPRRGKGAREKLRVYLGDGETARASSRRTARYPCPSSLPNPTSRGDGDPVEAPQTTHQRKGNPHCRPLPQPNPACGGIPSVGLTSSGAGLAPLL